MSTPNNAAAESVTRAILAVFRASGTLLAWGDRFAAPVGLTSSRWQMLGAIALAGEPLTAPRIASAMGVSRQGAQKQLDLLVSEGRIERLPNPGNARSPLYRLTRSGEGVYARIDQLWSARVQALAERLGPEDTAATRRFLSRLMAEFGPSE